METDNEQKLIFSGKTVEEALQNARDKLGLDSFTTLSYQVIEDPPKKKFLLFGGGKQEVRIEILFNRDDPDVEDNDSKKDVKQMVADVWANTGPSAMAKEQRKTSRRNVDKQAKPAVKSMIPVEVVEGVQSELNGLFQKMGLALSVNIQRSDTNPKGMRIVPTGKDLPWLHQRREESVRNLEELVLKMIKAKFDEDMKYQVYFSGGRPRRRNKRSEESIKKLVSESVQKAKASGQSVTLGPYNAYERRLVHRQVALEGGATSQSVGEGPSKRVTISKTT